MFLQVKSCVLARVGKSFVKSLSEWHVLKPETTKQNHRNKRNETTEMSKTTKTS